MDVETTSAHKSNSPDRPPTPYDFNLLKSLRTSAAVETLPPTTPPTKQRSQAGEVDEEANTKPTGLEASPTIFNGSPNSQTSGKRDSAIERSHSTARFENYAGARNSGATAAAAAAQTELPRQPSRGTLSSLRKSPSLKRLSGSPTQNRLRKKSLPDEVRQALEESEKPPPLPQHVRIRSFHGISMDIPKGELEGLSGADGLEFSSRGSVLLGGKKEGVLTEQAQISEEGYNEGIKQEIPEIKVPGEETHVEQNKEEEVIQESVPKDSAVEEEVPQSPKRLGAGRRKPSIQMLQAAIQDGRVLSAEEISFSIRLRSMYDHGDENAADWSNPAIPDTIRPITPEPEGMDRVMTPDPETTSLSVPKHRKTSSNSRIRPSASSRLPSIPRTSTEVAGGIEDFEDISARDVDRYGFIVPSLTLSRTSSTTNRPSTGARPSTSSAIRPSIQRVSTSLQLVANTPRRKRSTLRRGPSVATKRSARSMPPNKDKDARSLRTQASVRSLRSASSSLFEVRGRYGRLMDQASDMLTLPPGLESIAEAEDGGRTGEKLRRREWEREEKWRRMARRQTGEEGKGGGMAFSFDVADPRLVGRVWKGIPDRWRATAWHAFLSESRKRRNVGESDEVLVEEFHRLQGENCADDVQIDVDVPRSIGMHVMFRKRYRGGQRLLFRVLHAIALKFPETGYVQGMASLATTLLCYFDEEMAFVMMVRLWELRGLKRLFEHGFGGLMEALAEFDGQWLMGEVKSKLEELGIGGTAYGTRWYLTLFNMSIPFPAQLRVWDVFMLLGDGQVKVVKEGDGGFDGAELDVLHAASAALIDATRDILLDSDFENAMKVLTSWIPVKDEDLLMRVANAEWKAKKRRDKQS
ncbi:Rab-GTPase-TBC domain-containing protein 8 [Elsinoe fawcettii]|nr:Rab-GTPase-TBC domain-containing protein 8 [Elsinoe fawcettii]